MERDWAMVKLENFSLEMVPLQFQPGIDYSAPPPDSGMYLKSKSSLELLILVEKTGDPVRFLWICGLYHGISTCCHRVR